MLKYGCTSFGKADYYKNLLPFSTKSSLYSARWLRLETLELVPLSLYEAIREKQAHVPIPVFDGSSIEHELNDECVEALKEGNEGHSYGIYESYRDTQDQCEKLKIEVQAANTRIVEAKAETADEKTKREQAEADKEEETVKRKQAEADKLKADADKAEETAKRKQADADKAEAQKTIQHVMTVLLKEGKTPEEIEKQFGIKVPQPVIDNAPIDTPLVRNTEIPQRDAAIGTSPVRDTLGVRFLGNPTRRPSQPLPPNPANRDTLNENGSVDLERQGSNIPTLRNSQG